MEYYRNNGAYEKAINAYEIAVLYSPDYIEAKEALKRLQGETNYN